MKKFGKFLAASAAIVGAAYAVTSIVAAKKKKDSQYENDPDQKNPLEGKKVIFVENEDEPANADGAKGHLEAVGDSDHKAGVYEKYIKRGIDIVLSFGGLVVLSPVLLGIAVAIKIDDPGPVLFTQKRLGQNKKYFKLHKFRSMKMCTPHDRPTHMLDNPEQYITKVGKFIRAHSLDELPQIWDIFIGNMSVIGPRPGLWNQDLLTAERDKYGANDVKPGLTGWAQINGRDELEIPDKAKLDGEYVQNMGLAMDAKVFLGSLHVFGNDDSVVEGGTGEMKKTLDVTADGTKKEYVGTNPIYKKKILITGKGSYIGTCVREYLLENPDYYEIDELDTMGLVPSAETFTGYDVVFHTAGIAHIKETDENRHLYYDVNRDLTLKIAKAAKEAGVKQFIVLSSMSVYGKEKGYITKLTEPDPYSAYGKSKLEADRVLVTMDCPEFRVSILRPPMVYGKGCKGNYQQLRTFALKSPIFPNYRNERSMIYIGNLCEFVKCAIDQEISGVFFPQNAEYVCTSDMVAEIAKINHKKCKRIVIFNLPIKILPIEILYKVFGNLTYEKVDLVNKYSFAESIQLTEAE